MGKLLKVLLIITLFTTACRKGPPESLIPRDELVPMIVDFHILSSIQQSPDFRNITGRADSVDIYSYVFEKHGYAKEEFDSTMSWYTEHPEYLAQIYDDVIMKLSQIHDSIEIKRDVQ